MKPLDGIHHITAFTSDAQRNVDFYVDVMGLRLIKKSVNQDSTSVYHLFYGDEEAHPGSDITFFEYPGMRPGRAGAGMVHRIVWRVGSEAALDFWAQRLAAYGYESERTGTSLLFSDWEGLRHELLVVEVPDQPLMGIHPAIAPDVAIQGFHAVRAYSAEPDKSRPVLEELLGFSAHEVGGRPAWEARGERRGSSIIYDTPPEQRGLQGAGTVHHVAWAMADEDVPAWDQAVSESGEHSSGLIDRHYFRSIYFREPSGVLFELASNGPGFTVDEPLQSLGTKLSLTPKYEHLRPQIEPHLKPIVNPREQWEPSAIR